MASFFDNNDGDGDAVVDEAFFADFTSNTNVNNFASSTGNKTGRKKTGSNNNGDEFSSSSSSSDSDSDDEAILAQYTTNSPTSLEKPNDDITKRRGKKKQIDSSFSKPTFAATSNNHTSKQPMSGHTYIVTLDVHTELDIIWETDWRGKLVRVKQFRLIDSLPGPASEDGRIKIGHRLIEINGKLIPNDFHETILYLKTFTNTSTTNKKYSSNNNDDEITEKQVRYTLRFFSPENAPLSQNDLALKSVMKEVHLHKIALYRAQAEGLTKGFIERYRGDHMVTFHLHRESDNKFICGVSCKKNMQGDFIFHTLADMTWDAKLKDIPIQPSSATYLGRMVKNYTGTSFTLHDYRVTNPHSANAPKHQLATMLYKTNVSGGDPNAFTTILPRYDEEYLEGEQVESLINRHKLLKKKRSSLGQSMMDKLRRKKDLAYGSVEQREEAELIILQTQKPIYSEELQAYTLDFDGRVKMPCKRNFILSVDSENLRLVNEFGEGATLLRHGKINEDRYCLDYRYPLSPVQALAISVTSFADKLLVS
jgi:hypothetical protein